MKIYAVTKDPKGLTITEITEVNKMAHGRIVAAKCEYDVYQWAKGRKPFNLVIEIGV